MPPKKPSKAFQTEWEWVSGVNLDRISPKDEERMLRHGYNLTASLCEPLKCRKNCRQNPYCLNGLGLEKWDQFCEQKKSLLEEPDEELKKGTFPGGLRNLGATCYVNSYLQLWYHNIPFRRAVYQWAPGLLQHRKGEILQQLQRVFALMQSSPKQYVDPKDFIDTLGIDSAEQQDAQEFGKLFMGIVEDVMNGGSNIVDDLFKGSYAYVTRCSTCHTQSETISTFTELDLQIAGMKVLKDCLASYFTPEILDGDNQYFCQKCKKKVDATRQIVLKRLPPVLNIQLMRFIYDRKTGRKQKLSNFVQFPEHLDLSEYLGERGGKLVYELSAVLIHHGVSANSGHYNALIRENNTRRWFQYNDEKVTLQTGKVLKMEDKDEADLYSEEAPGPSKKPRLDQGMQGSKGAYMLVYQLVTGQPNRETAIQQPVIPETLENEMAELSTAAQCAEAMLKRENNQLVAHVQDKRHLIETAFHELFVTSNESIRDCDFVPKKVLETFFSPNNDEKNSGGFLEPIDMTPLMCPHGKLDFRQVVSFKCVKRAAAQQHLYSLFTCDKAVTFDNLCLACIKYKVAMLQLQQKIKSDAARVAALMKNFKPDTSSGYWIGTNSKKNWKKMAERNLAEHYGINPTAGTSDSAQDPDVTIMDASVTPEPSGSPREQATGEDQAENGAAEEEVDDLEFNEDLLCDHGNLTADEGAKRLIPVEAWKIIAGYFEGRRSVPTRFSSEETCGICEVQKFEDVEKVSQTKKVVAEWKSDLGDLISKKSRPTWDSNDEIYLICARFHQRLVAFVKDPVRKPLPATVCNQCLVCQSHDLMMIDPSVAFFDENLKEQFVAVWPEEFTKLLKKIVVDIPMRLIRLKNEAVECEPPFCQPCSVQFLVDIKSKEFTYHWGKIYISQVEDIIPVTNGCRPEEDSSQTQADLRRSSRQPKPRGSLSMEVKCETTIGEIKVFLMNRYKASPVDQHLFFCGVELTERDATLKSLRIPNNAVMQLQIDKPKPLDVVLAESCATAAVERGFQGSHLVG